MTADTGDEADDEGDSDSPRSPDDGATSGGPGSAGSDAPDTSGHADSASLSDQIDDLRTELDGLVDRAAQNRDIEQTRERIDALQADLDAIEERIDERTVERDDLEAELRRYVRRRVRRGHATGWGPYLVLLYGTVMTVGAFYYLGDWPAVVAMLVVWLSTLGLFVFMIVVSGALAAGKRLTGLRDLVGKLR